MLESFANFGTVREPLHILIRLPNWLGDMVMSAAFVQAVKDEYPGAVIDLIAKKGIDTLLDFFPPHHSRFVFSKLQYPGINGAWSFGRSIKAKKKYDLFFCLPDSFSSALIGFAVNARQRVGYSKELRNPLLTHAFRKKKKIHRVVEYTGLLEQFLKKKLSIDSVSLNNPLVQQKNSLIVNINSEAGSRRLPKAKALSLINHLQSNFEEEIILIGGPNEQAFVNEVYASLANKDRITNCAGQTDLRQLIGLLSSGKALLTTDSGPAHLANALGIPTVVLFGAGNESNTAPFNQRNRQIIRMGKLPCEPCVSNTCKPYGIPKCLVELDDRLIAAELTGIIKNS